MQVTYNAFEVICVGTYLSCQTWAIVTFWLWRIIQDFLTWTTSTSSIRLYKYVLLNRINNFQYLSVKRIFYLLFKYFRFRAYRKMYRIYLKFFFFLWLSVWLVKILQCIWKYYHLRVILLKMVIFVNFFLNFVTFWVIAEKLAKNSDLR